MPAYNLKLDNGKLMLKVADCPLLELPMAIPFEDFIEAEVVDMERSTYDDPPGWHDGWARKYVKEWRAFVEHLKGGGRREEIVEEE